MDTKAFPRPPTPQPLPIETLASTRESLPKNTSIGTIITTNTNSPPTDEAEDESKPTKRKRKREICQRCSRPIPRACICSTLPQPSSPLTLSRSIIVVLQHPHEVRRKNRSLPLVELCFRRFPGDDNDDGDGDSRHSNSKSSTVTVNDFNAVVGRRFGDQTNEEIMNLLQDPNQDIILFYPSDDAVSLKDGLDMIQRRRASPPTIATSAAINTTTTTHQNNDLAHDDNEAERTNANATITRDDNQREGSKIVLLFLDATWKYAQEMDKACTKHGVYPAHMVRVRLDPTADWDVNPDHHDGGTVNTSVTSTSTAVPRVEFQPRRFDIRTPPTPKHLSTAECIALAVSIVERDDMEIYRALMKPLDLMVQKWHSCTDRGGGGGGDEVNRVGKQRRRRN